MTLPTLLVEIAFTTQPDDPSPIYVDVTQWVRGLTPIRTVRGRQDQHSEVQPSTLNLTLINSDGRFTPGNVDSPYYPNVKKGRKIRVSVTHAGVTRRRFTGYIDEWPVTWADASATVADVSITASSRMARLGRASELRDIVGEEILSDNPRAYYPFGESEGAVLAGNASDYPRSPMTARQLGSGGGGIFFGTATGPPTDGMTAALFDRVDGSNGFYLQADFDQPVVTSADTTIALECFFLITATGTAHGLVDLHSVTSQENSSLYVSGMNDKLTAEGFDQDGLNNYLIDSIGALSANTTYHAMVTESVSGGNLTARLYLNGVEQDSQVVTRSAYHDRIRLRAGRGNSAASGSDVLDGVLSHVTVYAGTTLPSTTRIGAHSDAGSTGFSGESSGVRIRRLALYAGVPEGELDIATGLSTSITNQLTNGQQPVALMRDVARTEGGVLFDSGDGLLTFHARSHRYNALSALTLAAGGGELQANLEPRLDDQGLVNEVTASREGGVSVRAVDTASVDEYGVYREELDLLTTSDNEVTDAANWKVFVGSTPQVAVPVAEVDLGAASTSQKTAILQREIGDRITLGNLPSQAPAASMDFFVEGITEQITAERYLIAFNLSAAALSEVWQLDSSVYSVLNTTTRLGF